jgi:hypothetical protein
MYILIAQAAITFAMPNCLHAIEPKSGEWVNWPRPPNASKSDAPSTVGVKRGLPAKASTSKNQAAIAVAPISPATTPWRNGWRLSIGLRLA